MAKIEPGAETRGDRPRFEWSFARQAGLCYLGTHSNCQRRQRLMVFGKPPHKYNPDSSANKYAGAVATWEHVLPRKMRTPNWPTLKLLACYDCNHAKGDAAPSIEHVEAALDAAREWFQLPGNHGHAKAAVYIGQLERDAARFMRWAEPIEEADEVGRAELMHALGMTPKMLAHERKRERAEERARVAAAFEPLSAKIKRAKALGVTDPRFMPVREMVDDSTEQSNARRDAIQATHAYHRALMDKARQR